MKPEETQKTPQIDAFRVDLRDIVNPRHELVQICDHIDWESCHSEFSRLYADLGRPGSSVRLLVGLSLLKHTYDLSDEALIQRWVENPYYQYFCGEQFFQHKPPINPTTLGRFRRRLGEAGMKQLLSLTIKAGLSTGTIEDDSLKTVAVDTTVMEKAVRHPNDGALLKRAQEHLVKLAHEYGVKLRQTYEKEMSKLELQVGRYAHAKQFNRMRKALKAMASRVGRIARDILRKLKPENSDGHVLNKLKQAATLIKQARNPKMKAIAKLFSLHAPEVECISKVRREVVKVIVSLRYTLAQDETSRSVGCSLPEHASWATISCEASGTTYPSSRTGHRTKCERRSIPASVKAGWGQGWVVGSTYVNC